MLILLQLLAAFAFVAPKPAFAFGAPKPKEDASESRKAIIEEAYKQIEEATDRLLANGDSLWKIREIVNAKKSSAKTADFNRKIKRMLGPSTSVEVRFVEYGYDETANGDERHFLEWDILPAKQKSNDAMVAAQDGEPSSEKSSYRFGLGDPLDDMTLNLPGDWGEFEYFFNTITYRKDFQVIGEWKIPCLFQIEIDEMMHRTMAEQKDDPTPSLDSAKGFDEMKARMEKLREEVEPVAKEKFEKLKAETPEFSFATAVPGLFQEMRDNLGILETDLERALEAIQILARDQIYFDDIDFDVPPEGEQCNK